MAPTVRLSINTYEGQVNTLAKQETCHWIDDACCVINNGKNKFKGIIRGAGYGVITYFFNDIEELNFLNLNEWIYVIQGGEVS